MQIAYRRLLLATVTFALLAPTVGATGLHLINNGLAPPNADNVLSPSDGYVYGQDQFEITNAGCGAMPPCASPGAPTSVLMEAGTTTAYVGVRETSSLSVDGGSLTSLFASESASVVFRNGSVADQIDFRGSSRVEILGGTLQGSDGTPYIRESAQVTMSGGAFGTSNTPVYLQDDASLFMSGGGMWQGLVVSGNARFEMTGGTLGRSTGFGSSIAAIFRGGLMGDSFYQPVYVSSQLDWYGGRISSVVGPGLDVSGLVRIFGSDFTLDGVPIGFGSVTLPNYGVLAGTLSSGETFRVEAVTRGTGNFLLTPEPGTGVLVAAGLLVLGNRRNRRAARRG